MIHLPLGVVLAAAPALQAPTKGADAVLSLLDARGRTEGLLASIRAAGLDVELGALGDVTLLAPTDSAFGQVPPENVAALFEEPEQGTLRRILKAHVIEGSLDAAELLTRGEITTLGGIRLRVALEGGQLTIGGAAVTANDLRCEGGVVHELSGVLFPAQAATDPLQRLAARALDLGARLDASGQDAVLRMALAAAQELRPGALHGADLTAPAARTAAIQALYSGAYAPAAMNDRPELDDRLLMDFLGEGEPSWFTLNDDVMGGISSSRFSLEAPSTGVFSGALSLENNGGFATIRCRAQDFELEGYTGIRMRVRSDGREYGVSALAGDERGREGAWRKRFTAPAGEWVLVEVPFSEMVLNIRGRSFPDVGPPEPGRVQSFSFIIADKDTTPFRLEIDWIAAFR